jgi:flavin reductase (DIM6/NTAB) family NADH-FMN oxidoreductase RutF
MSEIFGRVGGPRDDGMDAAGERAPAEHVDAEMGRWLRRRHAGGVYALTTTAGDTYRATTVTGVLDVSLDPLLVLVSLERGSQMESWIEGSGVLGLSIMTVRQQFLADRFAGLAPLAPPRFQGIGHFTAVTGCPLLADSIGWADCRVTDRIGIGDHINLVSEVVAAGPGTGEDEEPLISFAGRYARIR